MEISITSKSYINGLEFEFGKSLFEVTLENGEVWFGAIRSLCNHIWFIPYDDNDGSHKIMLDQDNPIIKMNKIYNTYI